MRTGFKVFIVILVLALLALIFGPPLLMLFSGGGHV